MHHIDQAVAEILAGPSGARIGAFFDFDGTLIDGYSVTEFFKQRVKQRDVGWLEGAQVLLRAIKGVHTAEDFEDFVAFAMQAYAGRSVDEMSTLGDKLFADAIARTLFPEAWQLVQAHQRMGHTLVVASSATQFQVAPMARELGIEHLLCTPLEVKRGVLTGKLAGEPAWGEGKARAVRAFALRHRIDLARSWAYANGSEDVAFVQTAGHARPINPQPLLAEAARQHHWPVLNFPPRGKRPALATLTRSVLAYAGMAAAGSTGIAAGLLRGGRPDAVNLASMLTGEIGLALAGIRLQVQGEQNLWAQRPAIFAFNHQSQLDLLIMTKLVRQDFTGVAKAHTRKVPGFGAFFAFAGVAFVEPGSTERNLQAIQPAIDKLRAGTSLVIAPEGTRTATPRLGRFKKGPFHIALQTGVPIVPVVIRNAGALLRRGESTLRPGTVQVAVLPPIATDGWRAETLDQHVAEVRQRFADTLEHWPEPGRAAGEAPAVDVPKPAARAGRPAAGTTVKTAAAGKTAMTARPAKAAKPAKPAKSVKAVKAVAARKSTATKEPTATRKAAAPRMPATKRSTR